MRIAYVAGPYQAETEWELIDHIRRAEWVAIELWRKGYAVICPHKNTAHFGGLMPDSVWLRGDKEIIRRLNPATDIFVLTSDWDTSEGARAERDLALVCGIQVYYWPSVPHA